MCTVLHKQPGAEVDFVSNYEKTAAINIMMDAEIHTNVQ